MQRVRSCRRASRDARGPRPKSPICPPWNKSLLAPVSFLRNRYMKRHHARHLAVQRRARMNHPARATLEAPPFPLCPARYCIGSAPNSSTLNPVRAWCVISSAFFWFACRAVTQVSAAPIYGTFRLALRCFPAGQNEMGWHVFQATGDRICLSSR